MTQAKIQTCFYDYIGWYISIHPDTTGWKMENVNNQPVWLLLSPKRLLILALFKHRLKHNTVSFIFPAKELGIRVQKNKC